jgi:iron complex transport system permease protein
VISARRSEPTLRLGHLVAGGAFLLAAALAAVLIGPAGISPGEVLRILASKLPLAHHAHLPATEVAVIWQLRVPRVVLGGIVGATLASAGAAYQGVFQNPLADPYLLGVAAGAGLGATLVLVELPDAASWSFNPLPVAAFCGALVAVGATFALSRRAGIGRTTQSLILAGVAVGSFLTSTQTFIQQRNTGELASVYSWILGGLATAGWSEVLLILPYTICGVAVLIASRHLLDVMSVGDEEASSLGVSTERLRLIVIVAATLCSAAAVSVSGLIGFVGIIVPHAVRLGFGASYRRILPLSLLFGGGFLVLCDLLARSVAAPGEIPLGVVTAFLGGPFFLVVLRQSRQVG